MIGTKAADFQQRRYGPLIDRSQLRTVPQRPPSTWTFDFGNDREQGPRLMAYTHLPRNTAPLPAALVPGFFTVQERHRHPESLLHSTTTGKVFELDGSGWPSRAYT